MSFKRGVWRCAVPACGSPAGVSVAVYVSTPGSRRDRVKAFSAAVRLCLTDARDLARGTVPACLLVEMAKALKTVTGEAWEEKQTLKLAQSNKPKTTGKQT